MHSLALYASLPASRHAQALNILAGLAATQPTEVFTRVAIFSPVRVVADPNVITKKKNSTQQQPAQLSLVQLIEGLRREDFGSPDVSLTGDTAMADDSPSEDTSVATNRTWTLRTQEVPEPETKVVVLRRVTEQDISSTGARAYLDGAKHSFVNEYFTEGHRFVYRDTVLHLHRVLVPRPIPDTNAMRTTIPALHDLVLLDVSGSFMLEALVRVEDRSKAALMQTANEQLIGLRNELKGAVDLKVPERLSMDTRVKG